MALKREYDIIFAMNDHYSPSLIFYLSSYSVLKVEGPDAIKLLQGQLTCDIEKVADNEAIWGAHCNAKGRIISLFHLFRTENNYHLMMRRDMVPIALAELKKYAIFYKVKLSEIITDIWITNHRPDSSLHGIKLFDTFYLLLNTPNHALYPSYHDESAWKKNLIHQNIPTLYPATSGKLLPHEIHLDALNGLAFNKGCYTGQEIIARMHYLGKTKNSLYNTRITSASPPIIGETVHQTGMIIDYCHEERDIYHVLIRDKK